MKKIIRHLDKSLFGAIMFFGLMATVGVTAANAQDTVNPLLSTTGPNVLGEGRIQWNSDLQYLYIGMHFTDVSGCIITGYDANLTSYGAQTGLRFGIGNRAELTLDLAGAYNTFDTILFHNNTGITPSVGAKMLLADGNRWLPQVAFYTDVAYTFQQSSYRQGQWENRLQPEIGLQFRNRMGSRWALDYSFGYRWDRFGSDEPSYSLFARWLATDRLMLGAGFGNTNPARTFSGDFELRYQATDALQLTLQGGSSLGTRDVDFHSQTHALVGFSWMLR